MRPLASEFCSRMFLIHLFCKLLQILFPMSPRKKMSSICLHHGYGFSSISLKTSSSNSAINNLLYGGANVVPIAVPHFYFFPYPSSSFFLKIKNIVLKKNSANSTSVEVMTSLSCLKSSRLGRTFNLHWIYVRIHRFTSSSFTLISVNSKFFFEPIKIATIHCFLHR